MPISRAIPITRAMSTSRIQPVESLHRPVRSSSLLGPFQPVAMMAETEPRIPAVLTHHR